MSIEIPEKEMTQIKGLAYKVWKRSFSGIELDDLIQEGVLAYLKSYQKWEEDKSDYFMGFAYKRIYGAMLDYVARQSYSGKATVRPSFKEPETYVVPAPENLEEYHVQDDDIIHELEAEEVKRKFFEYVESLTILEKTILYLYFVDGVSMIRIGEIVHVNRLKIKTILNSCISYLKRRYGLDYEQEVDLTRLSRCYND